MKGRPGIARGFTLLEMLAATAMVAVLAGSLYASLHIAFKARASALSSVETVRKCNLCMELIGEDLRSAMVPNGVLAGEFVGSGGADVSGAGADLLSFYAATADVEPAVGTGDVSQIAYTCEMASDTGGGEGLLLVRRVTANLLAPRTAEPRQEVLCRGLRALWLRYYDGSAWQDNWDSTTQDNVLPQAVEVMIEWEPPPGAAGRLTSRVIPIPCGQGSDANSSSGASGASGASGGAP